MVQGSAVENVFCLQLSVFGCGSPRFAVLRFRVWSLGFRVQVLWFRVWSLGFRVQVLRCKV